MTTDTTQVPDQQAKQPMLRTTRLQLFAACAVLVGAYALVALAGDVRAWSGSDPGGKLATIEAMADGGPTHVDIGYWAAEADPEGRLHPVLNTERQGDAWVQSTPPLFALPASYLYRLGGIPAVLLLTVASAVIAALGARRIAMFLAAPSTADDGSDPAAAGRIAGWASFWMIGLGSVTIHYVADVWEHVPALGLTLGGLGLIATPLLAKRPISAGRAIAVGAMLGAAVALRREVVVWLVALAVAGALTSALRRAWTLRTVVAGAIGAGVVLLGSLLLEAWLSPKTASGGRVAAQTSEVGVLEDRRDDAWLSSLSLGPRLDARTVVLSCVVLVGLVLLGIAATRRLDRRAAALMTWGGGAFAAVGYAVVAAKLLLIPGAIPAQPVSAAATGASRGPQRAIAIAALAPWPVVWFIQWRGGMAFQYGGRYLMIGSALLVVVGAVSISRLGWRQPAAIVLLAATAATSLWSAAVHIERSRVLASAGAEVAERTEGDIVVLAFPFGRDTVSVRPDDARWLQALGTDDLDHAIEVARSAGVDQIDLVTRTGSRATLPVEGLLSQTEVGSSPVAGTRVTEISEVGYFRGDHLSVIRLQLDP